MLDRAIGIAGLAFTIVGLAFPFVFRGLSKRWGWGIFAGGLVLSGIAGGVLLIPVDAQTPAQSGNITAPNNAGIITSGQSGGMNIINQGPPRLPGGLYQAGEQIGSVEGASLSSDGKQLLLANPRIASGNVDFAANMEFQNLVVSCPALAPPTQGSAAFTIVTSVGTVACSVVGKR